MILPENFDAAERGERARSFFMDGYNCCQAVLMAFADVLEANGLAGEDLLKAIGSGFGGGFARMRQVCGSFSACTVMAGFIRPAISADMACRKANYILVQDMAAEFKARNGGSIVCGDLLGLNGNGSAVAGSTPTAVAGRTPSAVAVSTPSASAIEPPTPSERTPEYYRKRPCPQIIYNAAVIVAEKLLEE
jgi:hypothetical protein